MRFVDKICVDLRNRSAEAQFFVENDADYLADHFPLSPMLPGLMMLEIAAQTAAAWLTENLEASQTANFDLDLLERLYVTRRVIPEETLLVKVEISSLAADGKSAYVNAQATVTDEMAMRAKFHLRSTT